MSEIKTEIKTKINKRTVLVGEAPKSILIGDEYYLEELKRKDLTAKEKKSYKSLIFDAKKLLTNMEMVIFVDSVDTTLEDGFSYSSIEVSIGIAPKLVVGKGISLANAYAEHMHLKSTPFVEYSTSDIELGCDTASFIMKVDDRYDEFDTGADGYYGCVTQHSKKILNPKEGKASNYGYGIFLSFDEDLWTSEDLVDRFNYLFNTKIETLADKAKRA